jgi:hypothetical protein
MSGLIMACGNLRCAVHFQLSDNLPSQISRNGQQKGIVPRQAIIIFSTAGIMREQGDTRVALRRTSLGIICL